MYVYSIIIIIRMHIILYTYNVLVAIIIIVYI